VTLNGWRSGFGSTNSTIRILILHAVNRGALAAFVQILQLVTYMAFAKSSLYWLSLHLLGSKGERELCSRRMVSDVYSCTVYVNSLFAVLNARCLLERGDETFLSHGVDIYWDAGVILEDIQLSSYTPDNGGTRDESGIPSRTLHRASACGSANSHVDLEQAQGRPASYEDTSPGICQVLRSEAAIDS